MYKKGNADPCMSNAKTSFITGNALEYECDYLKYLKVKKVSH
jgi:hypothetical protein